MRGHQRVVIVLFFLISVFALPGSAWAQTGGVLTMPGVGSMNLPDWLEATEAKGIDEKRNAGLQYDMIGFNRNTWHYARLVIYRSDKNLGIASLLFNVAEANPQILGDLARTLLEKNLLDNGGRILAWAPAQKARLGGKNVPMISARLIMTDKVPLPMAATVYVFMRRDHLHAMGLFAPDSDRLFWTQLFRNMSTEMQWE